ncbi:MAG: RNA methyltransferase, partial [bacterium]|nr:RNA methyltransferase [bacterium]
MSKKPVNLYLCLVHYPVYNKYGEIVATSVTPLDLHDLGRTGLTYGIAGYYITTPFDSQWELLNEIIGHWREGIGAEKQPQRRQALKNAKLIRTMGDAFADVADIEGKEPCVAATTARWDAGTVPAQS